MPKKLLLADDSVTIQKVIGISFANEDVTLVTVDNGDDAVAKAQELRPDLVLADVVMPGKTGYEVCEAIKSDPSLRHIPVLLLTGTFEAFDEDRALQVGAAGHVAKPFEAQTLVNQVNQLLAASDSEAPKTVAVAEVEIEAPPHAVAETVEDGFDFFPDKLEVAEPISATPVAETIVEPLEPTFDGDALLEVAEDLELGSSLDLDPGLPSQDAAFTFGDDAFQDLNAEPIALSDPLDEPGESHAESTLAILPDDASEGLFDTAEAPANDLPPLQTEIVEPDFAAPGGEVEAIEANAIEPIAEEAGFATTLLDDGFGARSPDPGDLAQVTLLDPGGAAEFDVSTSDRGDSIPAPNQPSKDALDADVSRAAADAVLPKLREQLHDTLEKVAWESFGNITEEIVRQAVERVEAVAWEVIPRIAETLVQEEIRKMKGEE